MPTLSVSYPSPTKDEITHHSQKTLHHNQPPPSQQPPVNSQSPHSPLPLSINNTNGTARHTTSGGTEQQIGQIAPYEHTIPFIASHRRETSTDEEIPELTASLSDFLSPSSQTGTTRDPRQSQPPSLIKCKVNFHQQQNGSAEK
jgi:hypothetical protein